jgi:F-type H+-transporting ATPase subunit delta
VQGAVAKRYALALFDAGREQDKLELLDAQAKQLAVVFHDPLVRRFAGHPRIPASSKKDVLAGKLAGRFDTLLLNLVRVLVDKNRITALPEILHWFDLLTDQASGIENLTLLSATELSPAQRDQIVELSRRFSEYDNLRVETQVDPRLLGGVEVRIGGHLVLDGTVASRLQGLRDRLYKYRHRGVRA